MLQDNGQYVCSVRSYPYATIGVPFKIWWDMCLPEQYRGCGSRVMLSVIISIYQCAGHIDVEAMADELSPQ